MKAIMISIKPKWCALMMNGEKTIEVRKNKALANAIQKLIDENGYADIYVYCSKINKKHYHLIESIDTDTGKTEYEIDYYIGSEGYLDSCYEGKVAFKFRCYKVEEVESRKYSVYQFPYTETLDDYELLFKSCLTTKELDNYLAYDKKGYAIHIADLEIFDKPKELSEFYTTKLDEDLIKRLDNSIQLENGTWVKRITKAPQNMCYVEIGE